MAGQIKQYHQSPQQGQSTPQPSKPRQYPYRDGISSSQPYYDLYEMVRRPYAPPECRQPDPPAEYNQPPVLFAKQKKLVKTTQERFEKNHYELPDQRFAFVLAFVKFIFLVFVLPFYVVFVQAPFWLFSKLYHAIEIMCRVVHSAVIKVYNFSKQILYTLLMPFRAFLNLILDIFRHAASMFHKLFSIALTVKSRLLEIQRKMVRFAGAILTVMLSPCRFAIKAIQTVKNAPQRIYHTMKLLILRMSGSWSDMTASIKIFPASAARHVANQWIKPLRLWLTTCKEKIHFLQECSFARLKNFEGAIRAAISDPLTFLKIINRNVRKSMQPIQSFFNPFPGLLTKINQIEDSMALKLIKLYNQASSPLRNLRTRLFSSLHSCQQRIQSICQRMHSAVKSQLPAIKIHLPGVKLMTKKILFGTPQFVVLRTLRMRADSKLATMGSQIRAVCHEISILLSHRWQLIESFMQRVLFQVRLIVAWSIVLTRYGMELVRNRYL